MVLVALVAALALWSAHSDPHHSRHSRDDTRSAYEAHRDDHDDSHHRDDDDDLDHPRRMDLHKLARKVGKRWQGRLIGAQPVAARPGERALGADRVLELRWLTPDRDLLVIRVDPASGRILEVAGNGLERARK